MIYSANWHFTNRYVLFVCVCQRGGAATPHNQSSTTSTQGLAAAKVAIERMNKEGIKWKRPADYYAEMVKSDGHMRKVKDQLMYQQRQIEQADER